MIMIIKRKSMQAMIILPVDGIVFIKLLTGKYAIFICISMPTHFKNKSILTT